MSRFHSVLYSQRSFTGGVHVRKSSQILGGSRSVSFISASANNIQPDISADSEFFRFTPQNMLVQIDDILKSLPFGKLQKFVIFMHFLMFSTTSFIVYNYCFLLMMPTYLCTYQDPINPTKTFQEVCQREQFCSADVLPRPLSWEVDQTSRFSLNNWITVLDMHCSSSFEIGLFGSLYFAGYLFSCAIFPPLSDKFGRKIFTIGVCFVQLIALAAMLFIPNIMVYYLVNAIIGASQPLKAMIAYTHLMEWSHGYESITSGILFCYDGALFVLCPLMLLFISNNTQMFVWIALILNLVAIVIFFLFYFPESPVFLLDQGRYEEFNSVIQKLYDSNKVNDETQVKLNNLIARFKSQKTERLESRKQQNQEQSKGIMQLIKSDPSILYNLILMIMNWCAASFTFYLLSFFIKYMPGDIFVNSIVSGLCCFSLLMEGPIQKKLSTKVGQSISFALGLIAAVGICFFDKHTNQVVLYSLVLLIAKSGAELAFAFVTLIHLELFPTSFLVTSYGICNIFCRMVTMFAPIVAEIPNPMVPLTFLIGLNLVGVVGSIILKTRKLQQQNEQQNTDELLNKQQNKSQQQE
eukprot:403353395